MNSGLIGKIEKARRYSQEPNRVNIGSLTATFNGDNSSYEMSLQDGSEWACSCHTYRTFGDCQHIMALQQILGVMLDEDARRSASHHDNPEVAAMVERGSTSE